MSTIKLDTPFEDSHEVTRIGLLDLVRDCYNVDYSVSHLGGKVDTYTLVDLLRKTYPDCDDHEELAFSAIVTFDKFELTRLADEIQESVTSAVLGGARYRFLAEDGPQLDPGSSPLVERYFHVSGEESGLDVHRREDAERVKTCNGWTADNSTSDMSTSQAYTRREVVAWGDSVKLRYGSCPEDSPWLWGYMERYTRDTAALFEGVRLDNCHNTPVHVGEHMLRAARRVRPELYVVAELFTGDQNQDVEIINRLGISSCIRELCRAGTPRELGELLFTYGASQPCGSFDNTVVLETGSAVRAIKLQPTRPHALLMDQTHDNPCPFDQHPVSNALALSAAMCSAKCSIGSNRGYDELVPHHINVVTEERHYQEKIGVVTLIPAKKALLKLHAMLEGERYSESFVEQAQEDVIVVTRHCPETGVKVLVVMRTSWSEEDTCTALEHQFTVAGVDVEVLLDARITAHNTSFSPDPSIITGLQGVEIDVRKGEQSENLSVSNSTSGTINLKFTLFPGSVCVVKVQPAPQVTSAIRHLSSLQFDLEGLEGLDLLDMNYVMYRCELEEQSDGCGGVYAVPGHGPLPYAGVAGFAGLLDEIAGSNDLGHPLCVNLREGWWAADYTVNRLNLRGFEVGFSLGKVFERLKDVPDYMRPKAFAVVIRALWDACIRRVGQLIPGFHKLSSFKRGLVLTSIQLLGRVGRTGIPSGPHSTDRASLAAGLPHFSHGFMRCWGRDTFIALPGLLLSTGRLREAADLVVGFGRTMRYGLIPNLLSEGGCEPRFNCRDAVWWWFRAVLLLHQRSPAILQEEVHRLFRADDTRVAEEEECIVSVLDLLQETLVRHVTGIGFTEENAGPRLDEHLKEAGFYITAGVDPVTGFVTGGSRHNCGTWMDKVGSSDVAGNRGLPATPRHGAAVELVALCYQAVTWMSVLHRAGQSSHSGAGGLSYDEWTVRIRGNFEREFWTGRYYRDTVGGEKGDQLRPNQDLAFVIAPGLFEADHARSALGEVDELAGPLGMATLSPVDPDYRPVYNTADDGRDPSTAHGFNYHQGPEWVWVAGFYLRAKLKYGGGSDSDVTKDEIARVYNKVLLPHLRMVLGNPYRGLTELTQGGGWECEGSCPTQAWSNGTFLELLDEIEAVFS